MSAVATPSRPKAAIRKAAPPKAGAVAEVSEYTPARIKVAFGIVEELLNHAYATDEAHDWSGDSDRLLCIAHQLADEASIRPPVGADVDRVAFDIAALILAARVVPGDSESPERKALIDQAAMQLNWLTGCDTAGSDCCDPGVPRPAAPRPLAVPLPGNTSDDAASYSELARQANYEVLKLAEALQTLTLHEGSEEYAITFGIAARIAMLTEIVFHAAELHGCTREEIGTVELAELQRRFKGGL